MKRTFRERAAQQSWDEPRSTKRSFFERVLAVVKKIPKGSVMTYKDVARAAGSPGAARAVGSVMKSNHDPNVPCHRVVRSDGLMGEYNRGKKRKRALLKQEEAM